MSAAVRTDLAMIRSVKPGANRSICASILAAVSTEEPGGTWQYPQSVCFPAGALVGSTTPGCATRQKGRSGCRPAFTSVSLRATSSNEPPTCTVPVSRQATACQGTGPLSAQSTLQTPGPYLKRSSDLRCLAESAGPASSANWRGVRSRRTVLAGGRSASDRTQCPASSSPPTAASSAVSASTSLALPPSTTGQPTACAIIMNIRAECPGAHSSQRQHGVRRGAGEQRASLIGAEALRDQAGRRQAAEDEPGHRQRVAWQRPQRRQQVGQDQRRLPHERPEQSPVGAGVGAEAAGRLVHRAGQPGGAAAIYRLGEGDLRPG